MNRRAISVLGSNGSRAADGTRGARRRAGRARIFVGIGCLAAAFPALAQNWRLTSSASATETYTSNVNYSAQNQAESDLVTTITGNLLISGGTRFKLSGSIGATGLFYATHAQDSSLAFTPNVNLTGTLEAIDNFAYVDLQAAVSPSFLSPLGPQPSDLANATSNRFVSQTYAVSPYVRGRIPGSNVSYQVRDDNIWTVASHFGDSSVNAPSTYANQLTASVSAPPTPVGWTLDYGRTHYSNGNPAGSETISFVRVSVPYRIDPQLQVSARAGYERNDLLVTNQGLIYGVGAQWSPTERTQVGGFWDHRYFGSSYSLQISHRLPRAALSASLTRGLSTYPQLALSIPAGASVAAFVDAAFRTRIPDPAERAVAVQQFMAQSGLPPSLATPVNFYGANVTLQQSGSVSLALLGTRNSVTFTLFRSRSESISGKGNAALPPDLQVGQNNTQTGVGASFSHSLSGFTTLGANASYSRTTLDAAAGTLGNGRSNNGSLSLNLGTTLGPRTSGTASVSYSRFESPGFAVAGNSSSINVSAGVSHTF